MSVSRLQNLQGDLQPIAQQHNRTVACTQAYYVQHYQDPKETSPFPDGCFIVVKDDTQSVMDSFVDQMYPVGTVYMNALVQTDPNVLFNHGTWARITGRFLYAAATTDTLLDVGGASTVTLTQDNLPAEATFTIPALSLSIDDASTAHTHTTTQSTGNTTGNMSQHSTGWFDRGNPSNSGGTATDGTTFTVDTSFTARAEREGSDYDFNPRVYMSIQHTHTFTIPALTTGGMSANETHTHTGSTVSSTETISDFGSGTAFDIIPPYVNLAIWYRAS